MKAMSKCAPPSVEVGIWGRKVLVPVDFTHVSMHALEMAFLVAQHMPARIIALEVLDPLRYRTKDAFREQFVQKVNNRLRPDVDVARDWGREVNALTYQTIGMKTTIHHDIEDFAMRAAVDCMVLYTGNTMNEYLMPQSAAVRMFKHTRIPFFSFSSPGIPKTLKHILVPLDLSDHTLAKLEHALHLFKKIDATFHLMVVDAGFTKMEKQAAEQILELAQRLVRSHGVRITGRILAHSNIVDTVVAYALIVKADLICNMFSMDDAFGTFREDRISTTLIGRSPIPLYNFYVPPHG
jgi:nucleotide-binding universal stress UspA family protein